MILNINKATQLNYGGKTIKEFHLKWPVVYKTAKYWMVYTCIEKKKQESVSMKKIKFKWFFSIMKKVKEK